MIAAYRRVEYNSMLKMLLGKVLSAAGTTAGIGIPTLIGLSVLLMTDIKSWWLSSIFVGIAYLTYFFVKRKKEALGEQNRQNEGINPALLFEHA